MAARACTGCAGCTLPAASPSAAFHCNPPLPSSPLLPGIEASLTSAFLPASIVPPTPFSHPKVHDTLARVMGYCEQNDIHMAMATVEEALLFRCGRRSADCAGQSVASWLTRCCAPRADIWLPGCQLLQSN